MGKLELATSKELVDELFTRYPDAAFVGMRDANDDPEMFTTYERFQGHTILMQGMLTRLVRKIQDSEDYEERTEDDL